MTHQEQIDALAWRFSLDLQVAREMLEFLAEGIVGLRGRERYVWPGLGSFRWSGTRARNIRNPASGELMRLGRSTRLVFRASKHAKTRAA